MRLLIVGAGTVGMATGKGFARYGHEVVFFDRDEAKLIGLAREGYLTTLTPSEGDVYFVCTQEEDVRGALEDLGNLRGLRVVRSTTPLGDVRRLGLEWETRRREHVCHNPEFLREETALEDFLSPDRIVIGECCKRHGDLLEELYKPFNRPIVRTDPTTSELAKLACNANLSCSISFWNEIGEIADYWGVGFRDIAHIAELDRRISSHGLRFLGSYGGKCLEKDLDTLISCNSQSYRRLLKEIRVTNEYFKRKTKKE